MYQDDTFNTTYESESYDEPVEIKIGLVADCKKLNIRERPSVDAPIVCEVVYQTELMIDENESIEEFYKVCTAAGIEGFCMKKFIAVQP
jgi:hypothetical protein